MQNKGNTLTARMNKEQDMSPNEAFDYILKEYKLNADDIARQTGIHKSAISKFRNGKHEMGSGKLQKLVKALPPEARTHFNLLFSFDNTKVG